MIRNNSENSEEYHAMNESNSGTYFPEVDETEDNSEPEQKHHDLVQKYFYSKAYNNSLKARKQKRQQNRGLSKKVDKTSKSQLMKKAENLAKKEEEIYKYLNSQGKAILSYENIEREDFYASIRDAENYIIFKMPAENHIAKGPGFVEIFTDYLDFNNKYGKQEIKKGENADSIRLNEKEHFKTLGVFHLNEDSELIHRFKHFLVSAENPEE